MCGSVLHMGHYGAVCISASILFKYECRMENVFVLSWASVRRIVLGSVIPE